MTDIYWVIILIASIVAIPTIIGCSILRIIILVQDIKQRKQDKKWNLLHQKELGCSAAEIREIYNTDELLSDCCSAVHDETWHYNDEDSEGICSDCGDHATFNEGEDDAN